MHNKLFQKKKWSIDYFFSVSLHSAIFKLYGRGFSEDDLYTEIL